MRLNTSCFIVSASAFLHARGGNILYEFAKGHRVNAVLLINATPEREECAPIATIVPALNNQTEGTVFPRTPISASTQPSTGSFNCKTWCNERLRN